MLSVALILQEALCDYNTSLGLTDLERAHGRAVIHCKQQGAGGGAEFTAVASPLPRIPAVAFGAVPKLALTSTGAVLCTGGNHASQDWVMVVIAGFFIVHRVRVAVRGL